MIAPACAPIQFDADVAADKAQILAAALDYAGRGWRVIQMHRPDFAHPDFACTCEKVDCDSVGKHPSPDNWQRRASTDPARIEAWFGGRGAAWNLGLVGGPASDLLVVDIDPHNGGDAGFAQLEAQHGPLPPTVEVRSGGGGRHFYFRWPAGRDAAQFGNNASKLAPGVDVKVDRGCVVAPPSLHQRGRRYAWREGRAPGDLPLADLPEPWIAELARVSRGSGRRGDGQAGRGGATDDRGGRIAAGGRNAALTSLGGTMRRRGMTEAAIFAALLIENEERCEPPLPEAEVRTIAASVCRYDPDPDASDLDPGDLAFVDEELPDEGGAPEGGAGQSAQGGGREAAQDGGVPGARSYALTDAGNAERLVARFGRRFRYCHAWRQFLVYDGRRWRVDDTGSLMRLAKATARSILREAAGAPTDEASRALAKWGLASQSRQRLEAMLELAKTEPGIAVRPDDLDSDAWLLNVENGTLDLRAQTPDNRRLRPHDRADLITKLAPVAFDQEASCPTFDRFISRIMAGDAELIAYLQRAIGYSLTGATGERALFMPHGPTTTGKSTLLNVLHRLLGDYAASVETKTLMARHQEGGVSTDIARLKGARYVFATEGEEGQRLAEAQIKRLTGNDVVTARFLYGREFEFRPECKIWFATNHKPTVRGGDDAIWARIKLLPFGVRIPDDQIERDLDRRLLAERPGVLNWAVEGCLAWQRDGLGSAPAVDRATAAYRGDMDTLGQWLEEHCEVDARFAAHAGDLYRDYSEWIAEAGERPLAQRSFGLRLQERGFGQARDAWGQRKWRGLRLASVEDRNIASLDRARDARAGREEREGGGA